MVKKLIFVFTMTLIGCKKDNCLKCEYQGNAHLYCEDVFDHQSLTYDEMIELLTEDGWVCSDYDIR